MFANLQSLYAPATTVLYWLLLWMLPVLILAGLTWFFLSLPLRREERTRFLLELIETGLKSGQSVEHTIISSSQSRDVSLGARYHLLASYLEAGYGFSHALEKVPGLAPPQVRAMLQAGEHIGNLGQVLPACRRLDEARSQLRGATNYQISLLLVGNPVLLVATPFLLVKVFPVLSEIASGFGQRLPPVTRSFFDAGGAASILQFIPIVLVMAALAFYLGGPRLVQWLQAGWYPVLDWFFFALPWRRKRMQRDFSALLAVLLDADVPEDQAVRLAAECTANRVFIERAHRVLPRLEQGESLLLAVNEIDPTGEFRWRLANAVRAQRGFAASLAGWHEALEAKAFQQEQAAAQCVSTMLVVLNGLLVAWIASALFSGLVAAEAGQFLNLK